MGAVPPTLRRTLGLVPERSVPENNSLQKERSDMDSLFGFITQEVPAVSIRSRSLRSRQLAQLSDGGVR